MVRVMEAGLGAAVMWPEKLWNDSAVRPISAVPCCWHPDKYSCQTGLPVSCMIGLFVFMNAAKAANIVKWIHFLLAHLHFYQTGDSCFLLLAI